MNAPTHWSDDARFTESSTAFRGFFTELKEAFIERESLFTQLELALLCKEHVLIIGPPGTAKSAIAGAVLGRIVDDKSGRPSLFSKQLAENTVQTDLIGPVDFKVLTETGRTEHLTEEGMLGAVHAFLDEVFDGRDMLLRSILNVLHERELKHGRKVTPGRCECAVMTSNRYLSEVLQRSPETLQAFADRISFICFAPKSFARRSSRGQMLHRAQTGQRPALHARLTLQQLDVLQEAVEAVEVPPLVAEGMEELADALERDLLLQVAKLPDYVPTKYFSQRSMVKALWVLKAIVVRDRMYRRPERRLVAEAADLEMLQHFFLLGGPVEAELDGMIKQAADPRERAQLEIIRVEHKTFAQAYGKLAPSLQQSMEREGADLKAQEEVGAAEGQVRGWTASVASTTARSLREKLVPGPRHPDNRKPLLRAAELLLQAMEARTARGMAGQGEGRGGVALMGSFGDVLELAQRVPELKPRLPAVARGVAEFCRQAGQMIALAAEGSEFDDAVRLDGVSGLATNLAEELERIGELAMVAGSIVPEVVEPLRTHLKAMRERTSVALRRRATRTFTQSQAGRKGDPLEMLMGDSRRLRELERCLVELSPVHAGLRMELLAPLAEQYARDVVTVQPFSRLEQLQRLMQGVLDDLEREGASAGAALRVARDELERRVSAYAKGLAAPKLVNPDATRVLTGDAYTFYRQQLAAQAVEGELTALKNIDGILRAVGAVALPAETREQIANAEVQSIGVRVRYLSSWWSLVETALPIDKLRGGADSDKAFDALVKSRFPLLITREGEFVRLGAALARLAQEPGDRGEVVRALSQEAQRCEEAFSRFSRRLIDSRGKR